MSEIFS
jgi:hypothetical protein